MTLTKLFSDVQFICLVYFHEFVLRKYATMQRPAHCTHNGYYDLM